MPEHVFTKFAEANFLIPNLPAPLPVAWLKKLGIHEMPGGIKVEEWDYLHTAIYIDEVFDFLQHICVLCRLPADRYSDGSVWSFRARLVGHSGHGLWCPSYSQIWQSTITRTLYPRSSQRQEARLHCYYRTRCWLRCCKHSDLSYQVKGWQTLYYQRNKEMVYSSQNSVTPFANICVQDHQRHLGRLFSYGRPHRWARRWWHIDVGRAIERIPRCNHATT